MKLIHTADWHIGHTFYGYERSNEFMHFFKRLEEIIASEKPDVMLVSGDVFDTAVPSNSATSFYYDRIVELHSLFPNLQMIITAGNHDSPSFINAPAALLERFGATVIGSVERNGNEVDWDKLIIPIIQDGTPIAIVMAIPYLRRGDVSALGQGSEGIVAFFRIAYQKAVEMRKGADIPIVAMAHLSVVGSVYVKDTIVGGIDGVPIDIFCNGITYVAAGHIHRAQRILGCENICYSGSVVPLTFNEKYYNHSVRIVSFEGAKLHSINEFSTTPLMPLLTIPSEPSDFDTVKAELLAIPDEQTGFLEVNLKSDYRTADAKNQIINEFLAGKKIRFCAFHRIEDERSLFVSNSLSKPYSLEDFKEMQPRNLAQETYRLVTNEEMSDELMSLFDDVVKEVEEAKE